MGSRVQAQWLWCTGLVALWHVESLGPGSEPMFRASQGWFLTIGPPGKPQLLVLLIFFDPYFIYFLLDLYYFLLLTLSFACCSFSNSFWWQVRLLWFFFFFEIFLVCFFWGRSVSLWTSLSHSFCMVVFSLSFVSKYSFFKKTVYFELGYSWLTTLWYF